MSDEWHQTAMKAAGLRGISLSGYTVPPTKACANCVHFARLAQPIGDLHGICAQHLVSRSYAPVMSQSDGKFCVSFKDAGEARAARAIQELEAEDA